MTIKTFLDEQTGDMTTEFRFDPPVKTEAEEYGGDGADAVLVV